MSKKKIIVFQITGFGGKSPYYMPVESEEEQEEIIRLAQKLGFEVEGVVSNGTPMIKVASDIMYCELWRGDRRKRKQIGDFMDIINNLPEVSMAMGTVKFDHPKATQEQRYVNRQVVPSYH